MKVTRKLLPAALALMLLLSACGSAAQPPATPESPDRTGTPESPAATETLEQESAGLSPLAVAVARELGVSRRSELWLADDERAIRDTLKWFFLLRNDMGCEPEYDIPDFSRFFDESSPDYDSLTYCIDKARYFRLLAGNNGSPGLVWYNSDISINSLQIDGDTAYAEVYDKIDFVYEGVNFMSGAGTTYYIDLRRVDGVWRLSGLTAASSFDSGVTHEQLLEDIAALEAAQGQTEEGNE